MGARIIGYLLLPLYLCLGAFSFSACNGGSTNRCRATEQQALLKFKRGLYDSSRRLSSWVGDDCCNWKGVRCSNRTAHVTMLDLRGPSSGNYRDIRKLTGVIDPSLLELKQLMYLDLSGNYFNGTSIPRFIGSLSRLRYLNISDAAFGGTVPHELGNLTELRYLDLRWMTNPDRDLVVDNLRWVSRLSSLEYLDMSWMDLEGVDLFDQLNRLSRLSVLTLSDCNIDRIPATIPHVNLTSLETLDLSWNSISSRVPDWLFNISSLAIIDLSGNSWHGSLSGFGNLPSLKVLLLANNLFNGSIPKNIGTLCGLQRLDISDNRFSDVSMLEKSLAGCARYSLQVLNLHRSADYLP